MKNEHLIAERDRERERSRSWIQWILGILLGIIVGLLAYFGTSFNTKLDVMDKKQEKTSLEVAKNTILLELMVPKVEKIPDMQLELEGRVVTLEVTTVTKDKIKSSALKD